MPSREIIGNWILLNRTEFEYQNSYLFIKKDKNDVILIDSSGDYNREYRIPQELLLQLLDAYT